MLNLLDKVLEMEKAHGPHRNPKLLESLPNYSKFGPIGVCIHMRDQYGKEFKIKSWISLVSTTPQVNIGNVQKSSGKESQKMIMAISAMDVDQTTTFFMIIPIQMRLVVETVVAVAAVVVTLTEKGGV